ncbi:MAG: hypothetical protein LBM02_10040 [Lachnospiraceae bacterium]|jgi:hypothetical protein|nr:hypothetical protein [Lachnospiraceae bacterium]
MIVHPINIDFQIYDSHDPKVFIVLDTSVWGHISKKNAIIEITLPGEKKCVTHYFNKTAVNVFNAKNLYLQCQDCGDCDECNMLDLPDGIYNITIKGSPDSFNKTRKYLRTTKAQLELDKKYIKLGISDFDNDKDIKKQIDELNRIQLLLKSAEANVRYDNTEKASELLSKVQKYLEKNGKCKNCI